MSKKGLTFEQRRTLRSGLHVDTWSSNLVQFSTIKDKRNKKRLSMLLKGFAQSSTGVISETFMEAKERDGFYNFIEKDGRENNPITYEIVSDAYGLDTACRCAAYDTILSVQDTTYFNYSGLEDTEDLGLIGNDDARGVICHSTVAMTEGGIPLGLFQIKLWTRKDEEYGKKHQRHQKPIEEKESFRWLEGAKVTRQSLSSLSIPNPIRVIHVADRESDIYECLSEIQEHTQSCVIRCSHNRLCEDVRGRIRKVKDVVHGQKPVGQMLVEVKGKKNEPDRWANVTMRYAGITLKQPGKPTIQITLLEVVEEHPPELVEPLNWMLWTFEKITNLDECKRVIGIYKIRWLMEVYHKTAKSVMKVQRSQLKTDTRLEIYLVMCLAVALRILQIKLVSQQFPQEPCTMVYDEDEWRVAYLYKNKQLPQNVPTISEMTTTVAIMGGYYNRKSDGPPGVITLSRGLFKLLYLTEGYRMAKSDNLINHDSS